MISSAPGQDLCQVRSETRLPCVRPAATTILGTRFCERCAREQENYFAVGELTQVPRGKSGGTGSVEYTARAARSVYPADPRGGRQGSIARSAKATLLLVVAALSVLAASACGEAGQVRGGADTAAEAKAEPETTAREDTRPVEATVEGNGGRGVVARAGGADAAVARAGDAVARPGKARVQTDEAAREDSGSAPAKNAVEENRSRTDHPRKSHPGELTLHLGGDRGTSFSGICSVGEKKKAIAGRAPERYVFEPGDAGLECEIRKKDGGTLEVVVAGEGLRSVQQTAASGGTIRFAFSGDGISSSTSSISLSQTTGSSDRSSPNDPR